MDVDNDEDISLASKRQKTETILRLKVAKVFQCPIGHQQSAYMIDAQTKVLFTVYNVNMLPSLSPLIIYGFSDGNHTRNSDVSLTLKDPIDAFVVDESEYIDQDFFASWVFSIAESKIMSDILKEHNERIPDKRKAKKNMLEIALLRTLLKDSKNVGIQKVLKVFFNTTFSLTFLQTFRIFGKRDVKGSSTMIDEIRENAPLYVQKNNVSKMHISGLEHIGVSPKDIRIVESMQSIESSRYKYNTSEVDDDAKPFVKCIISKVDPDESKYIRMCDYETELFFAKLHTEGRLRVENSQSIKPFHKRTPIQRTLLFSEKSAPFKLVHPDDIVVSIIGAIVWNEDKSCTKKWNDAVTLAVNNCHFYGFQCMNIEHGNVKDIIPHLERKAMSFENTNGSCEFDSWWGVHELYFDMRTMTTHMTIVCSLTESKYTPHKVIKSLSSEISFTLFRHVHNVYVSEAHLMGYTSARLLVECLSSCSIGSLTLSGDNSRNVFCRYSTGLLFRSCSSLAVRVPQFGHIDETGCAKNVKNASFQLTTNDAYSLAFMDTSTLSPVHTFETGTIAICKHEKYAELVYIQSLYTQDAVKKMIQHIRHPFTGVQKAPMNLIQVNCANGHIRHVALFQSMKQTFLALPPKVYIGDIWNIHEGCLKHCSLDNECEWDNDQYNRARALCGLPERAISENDEDIRVAQISDWTYLQHSIEGADESNDKDKVEFDGTWD